MADIGTATVRIAPNMTGIQGKIADGFRGSAGPATAALGDEVNKNSSPFQNAIGKLGGVAKAGGLAIAGGIAAGAAGLAALTNKMVLSGANLEQQLGGSEAVFGEYAKSIQNTALSAYTNMGLSQNEFLQGVNKMGSLFQGAGFDVQTSMTMSSDAMQRASDIASIMGISTTDALEAVTGMAKGNFTMMDNLGVAMNDTAIGAYALSKGINKTTAEMSIQEKVGLAQQMFMEKTAKYAGNYAKENDTLSGSINTTKKAFDDFLSGGNTIDNFIGSLVNTIKIAVPQIVNLLPVLVDSLGQLLTAIIPVFSSMLPKLLPALINAVSMLLQALVGAMPTILQALIGALPMLIDAFVQLFLAIIKALPQIITILTAAMPAIINALVAGLTNPEALQAIIMGAVQLLLALIQAIPVIIPALVAAIPTIIDNIISTLTDPKFISQMMDAGVQILKAMISGTASMLGAVAKAAWDIIKTIADVLKPSNLFNIGSDVIKGIWNGIQDMGGWLKDKVVGFIKDKIPGPIKSALGIHSPSKVAAMLGKQVPAGLAQGIEGASSMVERAATNMANSALVGIGSPIVDASMAFGSNAANGAAYGSSNTSVQADFKGSNFYFGSAGAVSQWFKELNQDTMSVSMGLTPSQGMQT